MSRTRSVLLLGIASLFIAAPSSPPAEMPAWFAEHLAYITEGTGKWVTDNSAYQSDQEPFEAYGVEWKWSLGQQGLTGRLYGIQDGKEVATFWEFREFWHPGEEKVYLYQFGGNGTVGIGIVESTGAHESRAEQQFFYPNGTSAWVGHESIEAPSGEHTTKSFTITDGEWEPNRTYVWHRVDS